MQPVEDHNDLRHYRKVIEKYQKRGGHIDQRHRDLESEQDSYTAACLLEVDRNLEKEAQDGRKSREQNRQHRDRKGDREDLLEGEGHFRSLEEELERLEEARTDRNLGEGSGSRDKQEEDLGSLLCNRRDSDQDKEHHGQELEAWVDLVDSDPAHGDRNRVVEEVLASFQDA